MGILKNLGIGLESQMNEWCDKMLIKNYEIVGGRINARGPVIIYNKKWEELPYPFGIVIGDFTISSCKELTSFKNFPQKVTGNFICNFCLGLKSFDGIPVEVGKDFICLFSGVKIEDKDLKNTRIGGKIQNKNNEKIY